MRVIHVPLNRTFVPVSHDSAEKDASEVAMLLGYQTAKSWDDLENKYRSVILADAGSGKTFEMLSRAKAISEAGRASFFIRIEDIDSDFEDAFEVGDADAFIEWFQSSREAWFFLDSVDEARLYNPKAFEKAIRHFARRIKSGLHRAHIYISSRPYAWRFESDRRLVESLFPFSRLHAENVDDETTINSENGQEDEALNLFALRPLDLEDIKTFASYLDTPEVDRLITDIQRSNLMALAERPFDLEGLLEKWKSERRLEGRLELLHHNIKLRLQEIDPNRKLSQPLNVERALQGVQRLAAAVTLTGEAGIQVPDEPQVKAGIVAEEILYDWEPTDVRVLLERGIFNDVIYGAVRFRHRDILELLAAEWFYSLLQSGHSRRRVESLFFNEQYGEVVITPRLRPILPWLILFDSEIRQRAVKIEPEIVVEGGDPSRLPLHERQQILGHIVSRIAENKDDRSARDNSAIARIALHDLSQDALTLISNYYDNDDAIFFLGRLVWQGNMVNCLDALVPVALDSRRNIFARIASTRALVTVGTKEEILDFWHDLVKCSDVLPRRILAEILEDAPCADRSVDLLLVSINKLPPFNTFESSGLTESLHTFIDRLSFQSSDAENQILGKLVSGLYSFLNREPFHERRECRVSEEYIWLLGPALHAVERLVVNGAEECFSGASLEIMLMDPAVNFWRGESHTEYKTKLHELIPVWPELNDQLFWRSVENGRVYNEEKDRRLVNIWSLAWRGYYWKFEIDSFERILGFIRDREHDDKLLALSLAARLIMQSDKPSELEAEVRKIISDNRDLQLFLENYLHPLPSEQQKKWEKEDEERKERLEQEKQEHEQNRKQWIERLKESPELVRNPQYSEPHTFSNDQYWLLREVLEHGIRTTRGGHTDWKFLINEFGQEVAHAFRDAAMRHWRDFRPELLSDGADTRTISYSQIFAMIGLEIEAEEIENFPLNLDSKEVEHALRYAMWEINGFPRWLESVYKFYPKIVIATVWTELEYELKNDLSGNSILHDLNFHAPWIHVGLAPHILQWIGRSPVLDRTRLEYVINILLSGEVDLYRLSELAQLKISNPESEELVPNWYALWVDIEPEVAISAVEGWLENMNYDDATLKAQHFITALMGGRSTRSAGTSVKVYSNSASHLKRLYVLMHKYIRAADDIDRADGGVYSPELRDDAQDARDRLFKFLSEMPGKQAYLALTELIDEHPEDSYRAWMQKRAHMRALQDADLEPWTGGQVVDFKRLMSLSPVSHRQLFQVGVWKLYDFKEWLERGNDSLAETYKRACDETEMRKIVAHWLNEHSHGRYICAQENPLANDQRPDIWLQTGQEVAPVPIELKLLDKGWSGPDLCERLRNQLAGDYLRQEGADCGVMLLIWQGKQESRRWEIEGVLRNISELRESLLNYWRTISKHYPNISSIEVVVIDLTLRARKSNT